MKKLDARHALTAKARAEALAKRLADEPDTQNLRAALRKEMHQRQEKLERERRSLAKAC